jgi:flagellar protein FlgJ
MEISGIGSDLISTYSKISNSKDQESEFQKIFDRAIEEKNDEELKEACQEFEAYFVQQLFKEMRKTIPDGGLFEDSNEKKIYVDMLDEEYSKTISKRQAAGIADTLYKQLSTLSNKSEEL